MADQAMDSEDECSPEFQVQRNLHSDFDSTLKVPSVPDKSSLGQERMRVFLRIRPFTEQETNAGENQNCIEVEDSTVLVTHAPASSHTYKNCTYNGKIEKAHHKFTFSRIFGEDTDQKTFFDETVLGTVKEFLDGQNCLVFTYGVTNSGKTYTVQGEPRDAGILPRSLDVIFNSVGSRLMEDVSLKPNMFCDIQKMTPSSKFEGDKVKDAVLKLADSEEPDMVSMLGSDSSQVTVNSTLSEDSLMGNKSSSTDNLDRASDGPGLFQEVEIRERENAAIDIEMQGQIKILVYVSFAEIYNEQVFDLLEPLPKRKSGRRHVLQLREDKNGTPYIKGLKEIHVKSADEAYKILTVGKRNLQMACTKLNHNSSRSHCIFTVRMIKVVDKEDPHCARISMLSFCDLAGSERYAKTQNLGDRIKEAGNINTSLLTLGRCITTLRHNQQNRDHPQIVPFRESKLTRIFQSFFSGKGRASMIVNINQNAGTFDETLHALKYSAIAKQVIVEQETEKAGMKRKHPSSNRYVSLMLGQTPSKAQRQTIAWATPSTYRKILEEEENAKNLPLPSLDEDDDDFGDESDADDRVKELEALVDRLKKQLVVEKVQQTKLEQAIREEVCEEMSKQLVIIENSYSERLRLEQALAEEKADHKIGLLMQSYKRRRIADDDSSDETEEEMVSASLLAAERVKIQDRDAEIQSKTQEIKELTEEISELRKTAQEKQTEFEDALAQIKALNAEIMEHKEPNERLRTENGSYQHEAETNRIGELISKLADAESATGQAQQEVTKLQQMIDLLQCELSDRDDKISALSSQPKSDDLQELRDRCDYLEGKLEEKRTALEDAEEMLKEATKTVSEAESVGFEKDRQVDEMSAELEEVKGQLRAKEEEVVQLEQRNEQMKREESKKEQEKVNQMKELLEEAKKALKERAEEVDQLKEANETLLPFKQACKELQEQLDDYIFKVNEQAVENGELQEKLEKVEKKLKSCREKEAEASQGEKKRMEELIEEAAEANSALEKEISELREEKDRVLSSKEEEVQKLTAEVSRLEGAMSDFKTCVKSSKEGEEKALNELEEMRAKYKRLEDELEAREMSLSNLQEQCSILEEQITTGDSKERLVTLQHSNDKYVREVREMEARLREEKDRAEALQQELETVKQDREQVEFNLNSCQIELDEVKVTLESERKQHAEERSELDSRLGTMEKDSSQQLKQNESDHKETVEKMQKELEECTDKLKKAEEDKDAVQEALELRQQELEQTQAEVAKLTEQISAVQGDCDKLKAELKGLQDLLHESQAEAERETAKSEELQGQLREKEAQWEEMASQLRETGDKSLGELVSLKEKCSELEKVKTSVEAKLNSLEEENKILQTKCEECAQEVKAKEAELMKVKEEMAGKVAELEAKSDDRAKEVETSLKLEMEEGRLKMDLVQQKLNEELTTVKEEFSKKEMSIENYIKQISLLKEEISLLNQQVEKNKKREADLRSKLSEQTEVMKSQNEMITDLENKVEEFENKTQNAGDLEKQVQLAQNELQAVQNEVMDKASQVRELEAKVASCEKKIQNLEEDLEKKDQKIQSRQKSIVELMQKRDEERASYEIALKDANSNEMILAEMKAAIAEQESVMKTQDDVLQCREERIKELEQELDEQSTKYMDSMNKLDQLQEEQAGSQKQLTTFKEEVAALDSKLQESQRAKRRLEQELDKLSSEAADSRDTRTEMKSLKTQLHKLEDDLDRATSELREAKREIGKVTRERNQMQADARDTIAELRSLEKQVSEKNSSVTELQAELERVKSTAGEAASVKEAQAHALKNKFQILEDSKKMLEQEVSHLKEQLSLADTKKNQELQKWREERDKLVKGLEQILRDKENELHSLREEMESMRDVPQTPTWKGSESSQVQALQNQLDALKAAHREELAKVARGKDQIICEMRQQNQQLQACLASSAAVQAPSSSDDHESENNPPEVSHKPRKRASKRKTDEADSVASSDSQSDPASKKSRSRKSTRSSRRLQPKLDENEITLSAIREEDVINLSTLPSSPPAASPASRMDDDDSRVATFVSPAASPAVHQTPTKQKRSGASKRKRRQKAAASVNDSHTDDSTLEIPTSGRKLRSRVIE